MRVKDKGQCFSAHVRQVHRLVSVRKIGTSLNYNSNILRTVIEGMRDYRFLESNRDELIKYR